MQPQLHINMLAILAATAASFVFAFLWHGPLFGKTWARLMKVPMDVKPTMKMMLPALAWTLVGTFLTAYVMTFTGEIWRPSVWDRGADQPGYVYGILNGFWIWLGFYIPMQLSAVSWEQRPWGLFFLNSTFYLLNLQLIAQILANWR